MKLSEVTGKIKTAWLSLDAGTRGDVKMLALGLVLGVPVGLWLA